MMLRCALAALALALSSAPLLAQDAAPQHIVSLNLCTDNAVMIAARGWEILAAGRQDTLALETSARAPAGKPAPV